MNVKLNTQLTIIIYTFKINIYLREEKMKTIALSSIAILAITISYGFAENVNLGDMSVTATKIEQAITDSPAAVTVISKKKIEQRNVSRATDALALVPSLSLSSAQDGQMSQGTGSGNFTLRGMNSSRTAVLIDGMPMTDGFSSKVDFRTIMTDDIQQVEVVPGAFSSLYGSNAIGGVINFITKEPGEPETTIRYKQGFGDASGKDIYLRHSSKSKNGLGIVIGYGHQDRDGYVNEFVTKIPSATLVGTTPATGGILTTTSAGIPTYIVGDKGLTSWKQDNANLKLSYDISDNSKIYGGVAYNTYTTKQNGYNSYLVDAAGDPIISNASLSIDGSNKISLLETDFAASNPQKQGDLRLNIGYEGLIADDYKVKFEVGKKDTHNWYNLRTTGTFYDGLGVNDSSPSTAIDGLAQISFPIGSKNYVVAGLNQRNTELNREVYNLSNWRDEDTKTTLSEGVDGSSNMSSMFIQDEITILDNLKAYLGGRYDYWSTKGSNYKIGTGAYNNTFDERTDSAFSPKASIVYLPNKDITLRASAGKSFRAPDNYELYGTLYCCSKYYLSNPDLEPELATTYEFGAEWRPTQNIRTGFSIYQTNLKNMIYSKTLSATEVIKMNAGEASVKGLEIFGGIAINSWLNLDASYSLTNSKITENIADPSMVGNQIAQTPKNMWTLALSGKQGNLSGLIEAKYTDKVYGTESNVETVEGVYGSYDSYTVVNAKTSYDFTKNIKGSLAINNLLNTEAYKYYLLPSRNVTAELVLKF